MEDLWKWALVVVIYVFLRVSYSVAFCRLLIKSVLVTRLICPPGLTGDDSTSSKYMGGLHGKCMNT